MKKIYSLFLFMILIPVLSIAQIYKDRNASVEDRVNDLLSRMSLEEKIGQMTQGERKSVRNEDMKTYFLGSVLNGGGSFPGNNTPQDWANMYDAYQRKSLETRLAVPFIYGTDAVHGHSNLRNATIFPHNIGLGAANDPSLIERIGQATAKEVSATGVDWTFSPSLCVSRDERWGRAYECFGEDPEIGANLSASYIRGLQGSNMQGEHIVATAKHWIGDGGTTWGSGDHGYMMDRGNVNLNEQQLMNIHLPPYLPALAEGVETVMVSYSSFAGKKMHSHKHLITDVLKGELGFKGFVISDWDGVDEITQDYRTAIKTAIMAGVDMVMVPYNWKTYIRHLKSLVDNNEVPISRINDAVKRILRVKFKAGLFEFPYADRTHLNDGTIGSPEHRAIAREAVRKSLVLLKNEGNVLPLGRNQKVFVSGQYADDIGLQSGGWTVEWQGISGNNITSGTSILRGIEEAAAPGKITHDTAKNGKGAAGHDVAVVVAGEQKIERPNRTQVYTYAEGEGDSDQLYLSQKDLDIIYNIRANAPDVPIVLVLVSGRPLMIKDHLPSLKGVIAAWLPGTEGNGVADVLYGDYHPTGKLSFTWPKTMSQIPINKGDSAYDPLFPYGYTSSYTTTSSTTPYNGTPAEIPGTIQFEEYDRGGEGSAYHDTTPNNEGGKFRSDGVDIQDASVGGYNVGWLASEEWMVYGVDVAESGTYKLEFHVASKSTNGAFHIEMNGVNVTGTVNLPNTGGWQNWVTKTVNEIDLNQGLQEMKLVSTGASYNIDKVVFTKVNSGYSGNYRVESKRSGKVLDVAERSTNNGANIQQWKYAGGSNQRWNISSVGGGYYKIAAEHSGKLLDVARSSKSDGGNIHQWQDTGAFNQQWLIQDVGNGYVKIISRHSNKALDVVNNGTSNGGNIQQWRYYGGENQHWKLIP